MIRTVLFQTNGSQAVRLPKEVAFPDSVRDSVIVGKGAGRVIIPVNAIWDDFIEAPGIDLGKREQPLPSRPQAMPSLP
ncbi:MAG: AbrB/MazE/SpoVT family DNA-binding domain-containing protein [Acetobacteraceae bacterium]|nr:AbrB/MazE/SpoVT family DNA-binding domain-containing protein [Acetobacteraceae bacterium]